MSGTALRCTWFTGDLSVNESPLLQQYLHFRSEFMGHSMGGWGTRNLENKKN